MLRSINISSKVKLITHNLAEIVGSSKLLSISDLMKLTNSSTKLPMISLSSVSIFKKQSKSLEKEQFNFAIEPYGYKLNCLSRNLSCNINHRT